MEFGIKKCEILIMEKLSEQMVLDCQMGNTWKTLMKVVIRS